MTPSCSVDLFGAYMLRCPLALDSACNACTACLAIKTRDGDALPHAAMRITSTQRLKLPHESIVTISTFHGRSCDASWRYVEGKRASSPDWHLENRGAEGEGAAR
ncbi:MULTISPECIES: hypothetical protein [Ralstonia solanacearum species complex]|uniref:hypothetical protein n=1 Tax=Ralstonia solanacearum species complex TaxID=3116862 RepID=UPI001F08FB03|nr:hypothetical protein [Ralstonia solanacearum]BEU70657.1 hypothetical protein MAFF211271_02120 [Ralstonia pseudosolanacearum]